jgi:molybdopterin molybdotransferase
MLTVEQALDAMLPRIPLLGRERVEILAALGRVLAEVVVSRREIPPWPASSMDGYAVRAEDTGRGATLAVVGRVEAGSMPPRGVGRGEAMRIFTGAPLPVGADTVVPQEDVDAGEARIALRAAADRATYVRPCGEDVRAGERVLEPGTVLTSAELGLLASLGYSQVSVYRRPRVAILSTGDELADLGTEPGPGQIPNTNTYSLMAQVLEAGGQPANLGVAGDRLEVIEARVRSAADADALVSSAGVSVGELDLVRHALQRAGAELHLWQVSMRPGKPITFGSLGGRPVWGLPGNPVSAMVTFELFVRPALLKMGGRRRLMRPQVRATALEPVPNPGSRRAYLRVRLHAKDHRLGARLTGEQGSAILRSMVAADGLAVVPPDTVVPIGDELEIIQLRDLP